MTIQRSNRCYIIAILAFTLVQTGSAFTSSTSTTKTNSISRRELIDIIAKTTIFSILINQQPNVVNALDMESFENSLIEKDTTQCNSKEDPKCIPKLSGDEALCKYGVSGEYV